MSTPPARVSIGKKKIAILGGGMAALTTAFKLSESSEPYEITVYQMGWRLGGKGASGRNMDPQYHYRIEEHGLHVWSGLYDNAFRLIRKCYAELNRAPDMPLATWQDAFKPANLFVLEEEYKGEWLHWPLEAPTNTALPGEPDATLLLPQWEHYLELGVELMWRLFRGSSSGQQPDSPASPANDRWLNPLLDRLNSDFSTLGLNQAGRTLYGAYRLARLLAQGQGALLGVLGKEFQGAARAVGADIQQRALRLLLLLLARFMARYWERAQARLDRTPSRRRWIMLNFAYGHIRGVIEDNIIERGFDVINDLDYREWLGQYLVEDGGLTLNSPLAWFMYDAVFSYRDGDMQQPDLEAGVALHAVIRMLFTWKGSIIWRMQAGMGDVVFTPMYEVLRRRGVTFKFFHRVKQLHLSADEQAIERITLGRQAHLKDEAAGYQPLIDVKGLPCWPSSPLYEQLAEGEGLREAQVNFESYAAGEVEEVVLRVGEDFDEVVLGIPIAAHPFICRELIEASERWRQMIAHVKTVRTQALQLWLKPTAYQLGWTRMGSPMLTTYRVNPLNTWADMTHLVEKEALPADAGKYPLHLAYFCGPMQDDGDEAQASATARVRGNALRLLGGQIGHLWPHAAPQGHLDWSLLVDNRTEPQEGEARLDAQYLRANIEPSERYTIAARGSSRYRLPPGDSGFRNLYLAGDWTDNGFNMGNIEATTISGMLAANAICGHPALAQIVGLTFGRPARTSPKG